MAGIDAKTQRVNFDQKVRLNSTSTAAAAAAAARRDMLANPQADPSVPASKEVDLEQKSKRDDLLPPMLLKAIDQAGVLLPGIAVAYVTMQAGFWSAEYIGQGVLALNGINDGSSPISGIPVAILLGLGLNNTVFGGDLPKHLAPGLKFCTTTALRAGIVCVGIKLSAADILNTGAIGIPAVVLSVGAGLLFVPWLGQKLNIPTKMSTLIAAGTSICGVTAITAVSPAINAGTKDQAFAIANVVMFGMLGMLTYPYFANGMFEYSEQVGVFLGLAVHDTSQVIGAALTYKEVYADEKVLEVATVTKLTRNLFLAGVIPLLTYQHMKARDPSTSLKFSPAEMKKYVPGFVLGFVGMSLVRTMGDLSMDSTGAAFMVADPASWKAFHSYLGNELSGHYLLGTAMAAVGLGTSYKSLQGVGYKPFYLGLSAALVVGGAGFTAASLLPYTMDTANLTLIADVARNAELQLGLPDPLAGMSPADEAALQPGLPNLPPGINALPGLPGEAAVADGGGGLDSAGALRVGAAIGAASGGAAFALLKCLG